MIFDLFFRVGPAIQAIFKLGFEPKGELFFELTPEQYNKLENRVLPPNIVVVNFVVIGGIA